MSQLTDLSPPPRILMGPGPSDVDPRVLRALSAPLLGHLDPAFLEIMNEVMELLRHVFRTGNRVTFPVSGTGSAGMETVLVNLLEPGDRAVVGVNGLFGQRMADIAGRCGAEVIVVEAAWGDVIAPEAVEEALERSGGPVKLVAVVHAETSTGALQPIEPLAEVAHRAGALLVVDCVTSLGGCEVAVDAWDVDAAYSGTQKCLSCPPGLAPVTLNRRAEEILRARRHPVQSWYLDLTMITSYWGQERFYHHTAPISMMYALREALRLILEEGLDNRLRRHRLASAALVAGLEAMGLEAHVPVARRLPTLTAVKIPAGADDAGTRRALLREFGIEIGGGLGPLKGKIWRIGTMGYSCQRKNVFLLLTALESVLSRQGLPVGPGAGPAAAAVAYAAGGEA
ncbi:MAG: alanine--glyoxylate aminotransferase family protein [bacterium]|nr:alanine--glyoxylate aminotransferase family protein [bacterium]